MTRSIRGAAARVLPAALLLLAAPRGNGAPALESDAAASEALHQLLDQMQTAGSLTVGGEELVSKRALPALYGESGFQLFWTPERIGILRELVRDSAADGLRPEDYHSAALGRLASPAADAVAKARMDLLATDAYFLLIYHLYLGKVDPKSLDAQWNFAPRPVGEERAIAFMLEALRGDLRGAVEKVRPDHFLYEKARAALAEYREMASRGGWPTVPSGPALKVGAKDARVPALRRRLAVTGELSGQPLDSPDFDAPLAAAVAAFQARHRLEADGVAGPGTIAEMNVPVEARILQIRINLERARWVLHEITGNLVLVDVAGFEVKYLRERETVWKARVQIGKPYRQTPIFKSSIDYVVLNPTWTVPPGILAKDILPAVRRDPGYLGRKGLDVVDQGGRVIDAASIDWAKQTAGTFPYMLRQGPGPDNALGRVKMLFPNPYLVYLHDTPSKEQFQKEERSFSSGCIRVERPLELAALLLDDRDKWSAQAIDAVVAAGQTKTVRLAKTVPVLIMYWTIDPARAGQTVFKRDPYGRDPRLAEALDAPFQAGGRIKP